MADWYECIKNYDVICIDTCSWIKGFSGGNNFKGLGYALKKANRKLTLIYKVKKELEKHRDDKNDYSKSKKAQMALNLIEDFRTNRLIHEEMLGVNTAGTFADNHILSLVERDRVHKNILIITQDRGLSCDVLSKKNQKSVKSSKKLVVMRLENDGGLVETKLNYNSSDNGGQKKCKHNSSTNSSFHSKYTPKSSSNKRASEYISHSYRRSLGADAEEIIDKVSLFLTIILTGAFFFFGGILKIVHFSFPDWYWIVAYLLLEALLVRNIFCEALASYYPTFIFTTAHFIAMYGFFYGGKIMHFGVHFILLAVIGLGCYLVTKLNRGYSKFSTAWQPWLVAILFIAGWIFGLYDVILPSWGGVIIYFVFLAFICALSLKSCLSKLALIKGFLEGLGGVLCCVGLCFGGFFNVFWIHLILYAFIICLGAVSWYLSSIHHLPRLFA